MTATTVSRTETSSPTSSRLPRALTDLAALSAPALKARFAQGTPVRARDLAGHRFLGVSLLQPRLIERLTWQTFRKDVEVAGADGVIRGVNVRVPQRWQATDTPEQRVMPFVLTDTDDGCVIDYRATHPAWHPMGTSVDPLRRVLVDGDDDDWALIGVTELWLGPVHLRTPTWFALTTLRS